MMNKKGQLAIFVIVAIVIVAGILIYFAVKGSLFVSQISPEFRPVYDLYSECIQQDISRYVAERVNSCDFGKFYAQGFYITLGEPKVSVKIQDTTVAVDVSAAVTVSKENNSAIKSDHSVEINSKIGKFY